MIAETEPKQITKSPINDCALALMLLAQTNGGNARLAEMIECEWVKGIPYRMQNLQYNPFSAFETQFCLNSYHILTIGQIAAYLGRSHSSVDSYINRLIKNSKLASRKRFAKRRWPKKAL